MFEKFVKFFEEPETPNLPQEPEPPPLTPDGDYPIFRVVSPISEKLSATQAIGLIHALKARSQSQLLELSILGSRKGFAGNCF